MNDLTTPSALRRIGFTRRGMLRMSLGGFLGFASARQAELFGAPQPGWLMPLRRRPAPAKAAIVLWMNGGPSQFETWDPKDGHANGGPTKAIPTSAPGIRYADNMQNCAKQAEHIAVIRSMTSPASDHERGVYLLHTGYEPTGTLVHPSMGSITALEIGPESGELPNYVVLDGRGGGRSSGFLPPRCEPFAIAGEKVPNVFAPADISRDRFRSRMALLKEQDREFAADRPGEPAERRIAARDAADRLMHSPLLDGFDLSKEKPVILREYGDNRFGRGCLLARRLVERGVNFVEVNLEGWDTHANNFVLSKDLCKTLDPAMGTLIRDLRDRGLLSQTLVVCMGEFGRTPKINGNNGRDHFSKAWSVALAGGGIQGGRAIGSSGPDGMGVAERPVKVSDLFATIYSLVGIPPDKVNMSPLGRPIKVSDGGQPVKELLS